MKLSQIFTEEVSTFSGPGGKFTVVLDNVKWAWDVYSGDKVVKSFPFKEDDGMEQVEPLARQWAKDAANDKLSEADDLSELAPNVISDLEGKIREGCKPDDNGNFQPWANALELVHKAYEVLNVQRPKPSMKAGWKQYEELISFAVKELSKTRKSDDDSWRMTAGS